ncbi:MAG: hypothetical protein L0Z50_21210 [Verrucomicrobiales bacterium]|nr:hypothetical protein [Verrucomicrobiales bacterium]
MKFHMLDSNSGKAVTALGLALGLFANAYAADIYTQDFEGVVGPEWSVSSVATTPVGGRKFLGEFDNTSVALSLAALPAHSTVSVEFDAFIIESWDGNGDACCGPDIFDLSVVGGPAGLIHTTFSNHGPSFLNNQAYPGSYPGSSNPDTTGATELDTLGYSLIGSASHTDAVYHLSATFAHSSAVIEFLFSASGLQGIGDESWGIDNVRVSVGVPDAGTGTASLLSIAILALAVTRLIRGDRAICSRLR